MSTMFNFFDQSLPEIIYTLAYYFLGFLLLVTALLLITTSSSVHGILYLLLMFLLLTELAIFLKMEFLALIFIIIYIGAVCVLMLFHIKLIKTFVHRNNEIHNKNLFIPCLTLCIFIPCIQMITLALEHKINLNKKQAFRNIIESNVQESIKPNQSIQALLEEMYQELFTNAQKTSKSNFEFIYKFTEPNINLDKENLINNFIEETVRNFIKDIYYETLLLLEYMDNLEKEEHIDTLYYTDYTSWVDLLEDSNTTKILGVLIFTLFFFHLILGSLILLLTMISTITLALTELRKKKKQNLSDQIFTKIKTIFQKKDN